MECNTYKMYSVNSARLFKPVINYYSFALNYDNVEYRNALFALCVEFKSILISLLPRFS